MNKTKTITKALLALLFICLAVLLIYGLNVYRIQAAEKAAKEAEQAEAARVEAEKQAAIEAEQNRLQTIHDQLAAGTLDPNVKVAFLTFDDGPNDNSNRVLDILKEKGVKATFFTNGREDEEAKAIYKRIVDEGHTLGNHTYSHDYSLYNTPEAFYADITRQENLIREATGKEPVKVFRFPGGSNMTTSDVAAQVRNMGYNYFDWDASAGDGAPTILPPEQVIAKISGEVAGNQTPVILMHAENPEKSTSVEALPGLITELQNQGYELLPLSPDYNLMKYI